MEATPLQDITNLAPAGAGMPPAEAAALTRHIDMPAPVLHGPAGTVEHWCGT